MKTLSLALAAIFFVMNVFAQQINGPDAIIRLSLADVEKLINNSEGHQVQLKVVSAAIKARRMDLIKLCFENQHTRLDIVREAALISDPLFRDEVVVLMLKTPSAYWPNENPLSASPRTLGSLMVEPFTTAVNTRLPGVVATGSMLETSALRVQLAASLAESLSKTRAASSDSSHSPPKQDEAAAPLRVPSAVRTPTSEQSKVESATTSDKHAAPTLWFVWLIIVGAAMGLLWFLFKSRK